jgi:MFS family permease
LQEWGCECGANDFANPVSLHMEISSHMKNLLPPALQHRRYRMLWFGLLTSIVGNRMQFAVVLWHINTINGEAIALGGLGLVRILPILIFSLVAGVVADVANRRRLMLLTQGVLALMSLLLGWLTLRGMESLWAIYAIMAASAAVSAFDLPARQSLVPNLVPRHNLTNAFSMNAIAFQFGSIVGPALAGLVLANTNMAYAYFINALSYIAVIVALIRMGPVEQETVDRGTIMQGRFLRSIAEGLRFVVGQPIIFSSMLLDFFATFFSSATYLLPIFATDILHVDAVGYGWLLAAPAVGAGLVSLVLAFYRTIRRQGVVLLISVAGFGIATVVFGVSRTFWLTFTALAFTGVTDGISVIIRNTVRQLQTPDNLRGRMTSVNQMFFRGGPQLGEMEAGIVGQLFGAPLAVISGGIACLIAVAALALRYPELRNFQGDEPIQAGKSAVQPNA